MSRRNLKLCLLTASALILLTWSILAAKPDAVQASNSDAIHISPQAPASATLLGVSPRLDQIGPRPQIGPGIHRLPFRHRRLFVLDAGEKPGPGGSARRHTPTPTPKPTPTPTPKPTPTPTPKPTPTPSPTPTPTPSPTPTPTPTPSPSVMPTPSLSFAGTNNSENGSLNGGYVLPPDTEGAVGPNNYVQVTNLLINVYDKSGGLLLEEPIGGLFGFSTCGIEPLGDPVVVHDQISDRWLITQIAGQSFPSLAGPFYECVAVSTTSDPTGSYYLYSLQTPNNYLNDYPKWAAWSDGYYMSTNLFGGTGYNTFEGIETLAWDRNAMINGSSSVTVIGATLAPSTGVQGALPASYDGTAPPAGEPEHFAALLSTTLGDAVDGLAIYDFHADFVTVGNSTFAQRGESPVPVPAFNPIICADPNGNCVPQPGTSQKLEVLSDRLMYRLQYRNFGTHEALVSNHTVLGPGGQAAVRYYELQNLSLNGTFSMNDEGTYAPDGNFRWMGSASVDHDDNLVVGYSVASTGVFPSIRYAGRLAAQKGAGLAEGEATLIAGHGSQTDASARWGDYSALQLDADDCTFWYTNEYYSSTSALTWQTQIGAFKFPTCP